MKKKTVRKPYPTQRSSAPTKPKTTLNAKKRGRPPKTIIEPTRTLRRSTRGKPVETHYEDAGVAVESQTHIGRQPRRSTRALRGGTGRRLSKAHEEIADAAFNGAEYDLKKGREDLRDDDWDHPELDPELETDDDEQQFEEELDVDNLGSAEVPKSDPLDDLDEQSKIIEQTRELWRRRQDWHKAEKRLTLQCSAICRRYVGAHHNVGLVGIRPDMNKKQQALMKRLIKEGGLLMKKLQAGELNGNHYVVKSCLPLLLSRARLRPYRKRLERDLEKLVSSLPVSAWVDDPVNRGFGLLSLAMMIGECGDIGTYRNISALWKRMGLAVINGERQRKVLGPDAVLHGYKPARRSCAWNIAGNLLKQQGTNGPYRRFYDLEKQRQIDRGLKKGHAHNRAARHMTKKLIRRLYNNWQSNLAT